MLLEVSITPDMVRRAEKKSVDMGKLHCSITQGEGNLAGFVGEEIVAQYLNAKVMNTYDYDVLYKGIKIDVKTKRTTVAPLAHYECSVAAYNTTQDCHWYAFVRVANSMDRGWILGYMPKDTFYQLAEKHVAGEYDPSNKYYFKADCYNMRINQLYDLPTSNTKLTVTSLISGSRLKVLDKCINAFKFYSNGTEIICANTSFKIKEMATELYS